MMTCQDYRSPKPQATPLFWLLSFGLAIFLFVLTLRSLNQWKPTLLPPPVSTVEWIELVDPASVRSPILSQESEMKPIQKEMVSEVSKKNQEEIIPELSQEPLLNELIQEEEQDTLSMKNIKTSATSKGSGTILSQKTPSFSQIKEALAQSKQESSISTTVAPAQVLQNSETVNSKEKKTPLEISSTPKKLTRDESIQKEQEMLSMKNKKISASSKDSSTMIPQEIPSFPQTKEALTESKQESSILTTVAPTQLLQKVETLVSKERKVSTEESSVSNQDTQEKLVASIAVNNQENVFNNLSTEAIENTPSDSRQPVEKIQTFEPLASNYFLKPVKQQNTSPSLIQPSFTDSSAQKRNYSAQEGYPLLPGSPNAPNGAFTLSNYNWPYESYMGRWGKLLMYSWNANPPMDYIQRRIPQGGDVFVLVTISANGTLISYENTHSIDSSGAMIDSVLNAILATSNLPPLPEDYMDDILKVHFRFHYPAL